MIKIMIVMKEIYRRTKPAMNEKEIKFMSQFSKHALS